METSHVTITPRMPNQKAFDDVKIPQSSVRRREAFPTVAPWAACPPSAGLGKGVRGAWPPGEARAMGGERRGRRPRIRVPETDTGPRSPYPLAPPTASTARGMSGTMARERTSRGRVPHPFPRRRTQRGWEATLVLVFEEARSASRIRDSPRFFRATRPSAAPLQRQLLPRRRPEHRRP